MWYSSGVQKRWSCKFVSFSGLSFINCSFPSFSSLYHYASDVMAQCCHIMLRSHLPLDNTFIVTDGTCSPNTLVTQIAFSLPFKQFSKRGNLAGGTCWKSYYSDNRPKPPPLEMWEEFFRLIFNAVLPVNNKFEIHWKISDEWQKVRTSFRLKTVSHKNELFRVSCVTGTRWWFRDSDNETVEE